MWGMQPQSLEELPIFFKLQALRVSLNHGETQNNVAGVERRWRGVGRPLRAMQDLRSSLGWPCLAVLDGHKEAGYGTVNISRFQDIQYISWKE